MTSGGNDRTSDLASVAVMTVAGPVVAMTVAGPVVAMTVAGPVVAMTVAPGVRACGVATTEGGTIAAAAPVAPLDRAVVTTDATPPTSR